MNVLVGKSALLKELSFIQGVVERKNTIPILSNLLLESVNGGIGIKGTDMDVSISTLCEAEVRKPGSVCVQAKKLFEIVRALPDSEIEIKVGENEQVGIVCERARFKMPGIARDNFPEIPVFDGRFVSLPAEMISTFIGRTAFAITNEESRYALNGAKFELAAGAARMVATDGHRLAFVEKKSDSFDGDKIDALIPKKTLAELAKLCADGSDAVEVGRSENHLFFRVGKRLLASRTLSGQFPNYEMVLPKENKHRLSLPGSVISGAIRRVALMSDERSHAVRFEVGEGQVNITSQAAGAINAQITNNPNLAPPGWYMLFIVNQQGVPSVASWIHLA